MWHLHNELSKSVFVFKSAQNIAHTNTSSWANVVLVRFFVILYQISNLLSIIIQCDVTCCIICLSNKVKYLPKEEGKKKITKEVVLSLLNDLCNA